MSCARPANRFSRKSPAVAGLFSWLCPASFSLLSYSAFFSLSCSALSRTSTDTRHLLTIYTQKAARFDKGSCRSRCCGQAGNSLSCPGLRRTSLLDSRAKHGNDSIIFFCHPRTSAARSGDLFLMDCQINFGNDNIFFLCLTFNIVAFLCDKNKGGSIIGRQKNL